MVIDYSQVLLEKNTQLVILRYLAERAAPQSVLLYVFYGIYFFNFIFYLFWTFRIVLRLLLLSFSNIF